MNTFPGGLLARALIVLIVSISGASAEEAAFPVDRGFLSVAYEDMRLVERPSGFDLVYITEGAFERLADYDGIIVDQPEIWIDK